MIEEFDVNPGNIRVDGNLITDQFKNGSDYQLVNNQETNVKSNDLPENIANGGSDGSTEGWVEYHGATIDSIPLDFESYGTNGIEVSCPGLSANEGTTTALIAVAPNMVHKVDWAVIGEPGATIQLYLAELDAGGNILSFVGGGYVDLTGSPQVIPLSIPFTTGVNLAIVTQTDYAIQDTTFVCLGGTLDGPEGEWLPGGSVIADESVILKEAKTPSKDFIKGVFVEDYVIIDHLEDYSVLEEKGANHIWYLDHQLQANNNLCKERLTSNLDALASVNLKFHFCVLPFVGVDGNPADPADLDYRATFLSLIEDIINTYPQIQGISLNDYFYPDVYWQTTTPEERTANRQTLVDFATAVRDLVHTHGLTFSINLIDPASHDAYVEDLAPVCDLFMPEIYRGMGTAPIGVSLQAQHRWYASMLEEYISKAGTTPVLPSFITYDLFRDSNEYPDEPEFPTEDIIRDINVIFDHETAGYVMCEHGYCPLDIYLPDGKAVDDNHQFSRRVTTQGLMENEGVILPSGTIIADLQVKAPLNKVLRIYAGPSTYQTITGTGSYESFNDIFDPTDPAYQITTDTADGFTFNVNIPHSGYTLYNAVISDIVNSALPPVGDTSILVQTDSASDGVDEYPYTLDVDSDDSIWHSLYLKGSGTVHLQSFERDPNGVILTYHNSLQLVLTSTYQLLELNTIIGSGVLCSCKVVTNSNEEESFEVNGVYINKGDTPRTGKNLAPDNVASTGGNGTVDGFRAQGENTVISVNPVSDGIELSYPAPT